MRSVLVNGRVWEDVGELDGLMEVADSGDEVGVLLASKGLGGTRGMMGNWSVASMLIAGGRLEGDGT